MTLRPFLKQLSTHSSTNGKKVVKYIDKELRNTLAHGSYWFRAGVIYTTKNWRLDCISPIPLEELMKRTKKQNIVSQSFIVSLDEKINANYFLKI